jgi:hypothetical protein
MDLAEREWEAVDWTNVTQIKGNWCPLANTRVNVLFQQEVGDYFTTWAIFIISSTISFFSLYFFT